MSDGENLHCPACGHRFGVLAGLIVGHFFGRLLKPMRESAVYVFVNHAKGALVLTCAAALCVSLLASSCSFGPFANLLLTAAVSFYFGSRS